MPLPTVDITKTDGNTGVVKPGATGILAIIAPSQQGTVNLASAYASATQAKTYFGVGLLVEAAAWDMDRSGNSVVLVRATASTAGAYGTIDDSGVAGTSVITAGAPVPLDDYANVTFLFLTGGTVGTTGITYKYSLDGISFSATTALGTANTITIPNSGVGIALAAGTIVANDVVTFNTTGPHLTNSDLVDALEALRVTTLPFESILVGTPVTGTMFDTAAAWRLARDGEGRYYNFVENTVLRNPGTQTEAQYKTALDAAFNSHADTGTVLAADGFDAASGLTGLVQPRPLAMDVAAAGMSVALGVDVAAVALGNRVGVVIDDGAGNPKYHNEQIYPGLDDDRFTTTRTFLGDGAPNGTFITDANLFSPSGSDYVYWQHIRCMNRACSIAKQLLTQKLSSGVGKETRKIGNANVVTIAEEDAREIEDTVTAAVQKDLKGQVADAKFTLSRTDDISSNAGATLNGFLDLVALAYIKKFLVQARFQKTITGQT